MERVGVLEWQYDCCWDAPDERALEGIRIKAR